ncbi:MAG: efflux RND transporter permease subunit [Pseudomonadales bacterium]
MERFLRFFIERHLLINVLAAAMVILGYIAASNLQREFIPSVDSPVLFITAALPGASARDIETKITIPIEEALEEIEGIDEHTTVISDNTSFTTVELYQDYDRTQIEEGEQDLRAAINDITDFPAEMEDEPVLEQFNPARSTVIEVGLWGPNEAVIATAEDLEDRLERLDLISSVNPVGLHEPEVRILVDPVLAREHGVTLTNLIAAVNNRNVSSTGGTLESPENRRQVVMWSRFEEPEEVGDTILKVGADGGTLRVRDIARIQNGRQDTGLIVHVNGNRGISLAVKKRESADIIDAAQAVRDALATAPIAEGVEFKLINDESVIIKNRLELMARNGLIGIVLVALILFLFVRPGPAVWILLGIPIVFLGSLTLVGPLGMTLNMMALTGLIIVLGMVVDDAVVVSERIVLKQSQGLAPADAAVAGALEMVRPVTAAAITTMLAFLPMVFLGGMPGKIVWQIPTVVVIVLLFSLTESFCILPAHMSTLRPTSNLTKRPFMQALEAGYRRSITFALRHRLLIVFIALTAFFSVMIFIRPQVPFVLFPQDDADRLFVKVTAPAGTSLERTEAITASLESQIMQITASDYDAVNARIGHQNTDSADKGFGESDNEALIIVQFRRFGREFTNAQWMEKIPNRLQVPAGVKVVFQSEYFGPPTDQPVTIHVLANDDEIRRGVAFEIEQYLQRTPGLVEIEIDERPGTPQLELNLNYEKLARRQLDAQQVGLTLAAAFYGIEASEHRDLDDTTELRVQFDPAARGDLDALLETPVRSNTGELVRLRDVVDPMEIPAITRIYHRDGYRSATIRASFTEASGLTALSFAARLNQELFPRFQGVPDLYVFSGGEASETEETTGSVAVAASLAVVGIGVVIWLMLNSFLEALFVMLVIPFAVAGVFLVFFLHGKPLSLFAMMGVVGLAGVVVNGSIVMVDSIHRRVNEAKGTADESNANDDEHIVDAVVERLRPILVTTLTTLGGVLPTAYGIGGYDPIVSVISLAIGWGLALSTLTTLFLVPVLYSTARDLRGKLSFRSRAAEPVTVAD